MDVCHSCDTPACCNPAHLFVGTAADNMADCKKKGRNSLPPHKYGEEHHNVKFGKTAALSILSDARSPQIIATEYGVSYMTIYRLKRGQTWKGLQV
jgi:hypothetical protein